MTVLPNACTRACPKQNGDRRPAINIFRPFISKQLTHAHPTPCTTHSPTLLLIHPALVPIIVVVSQVQVSFASPWLYRCCEKEEARPSIVCLPWLDPPIAPPFYSPFPLPPSLRVTTSRSMAAVSAILSPHDASTMTSRRVPLANNINAVNSPFRTVGAPGGKRSRAHNTEQMVFGQPPSKKQAIDADHDENTAPRTTLTRQSLAQQEAEAKLFMRKAPNAAPTAFERKLAAAREKKPGVPKVDARAQKQGDSLETIRQWQKHYKKAFPQYVFYFESVPDDVRSRVSRQISYLGAVRTMSPIRRPVSSRTFTDCCGRKRRSSSRDP